jgi:drug/metabolite transporter (DMT)-like permease
MLTGIFAGLAAGALWGLTFVAPRAVLPYTEVDIGVLRYLAFGLTSLALMAASKKFRPGPMTSQRMAQALWLGLSGFVIYYLCVALSVSLAGPAIAPLVIGALPLTLAIYGNWQDRTVTWRNLAGPLLMIGSGLAVINVSAFQTTVSPEQKSMLALGVALAVLGHIVWFLYAISNAKAMRAADAPGILGWTSLQGLGAAAGIIPLLILAPLMGWSKVPELGFAGHEGQRLLIWALVLGVIASWVAQYFWSVASNKLPLALSAQLIVSETIFALIYGFTFEGRWPHAAEWAGSALLITGVFWGVRIFSKQKPSS